MARLSDQLREWLDRAEIFARGAERLRADAAAALAADRPRDARTIALLLLRTVPRSPSALALWLDAAEALWLDHEAVRAAERLASALPFRADVWLRLAVARRRVGASPSEALERAALAGDPRPASDAALLALADRDLAAGDPERAERWLDGLGLGVRDEPASLTRRLVAALDTGDVDRAVALGERVPPPEPLDAIGWLARARWLAAKGEPTAAFAMTRALMLDPEGAERAATSFVSTLDDAVALGRFRDVVAAVGRAQAPGWRAAFALAEGRADEALAALADAARADPSPAGVRAFASAAVRARDAGALRDAVALDHGRRPAIPDSVHALASALSEEDPHARIAALEAATGEAAAWAAQERRAIHERWLARDGIVAWRSVTREIAELARRSGMLDVLPDLEALSRELERPVVLAVVGEFNAGKSSFINALLGEEVAPVGVLPTTAQVNHLAWAPDRFARIRRFGADDRLLPHDQVRAALQTLDSRDIDRVVIYAPLEVLRIVEIVDTPGFNAPASEHAATAQRALEGAHVALFLCDATQPLKESERAVLRHIADGGTPLLVLLNKADRLAHDEVRVAVDHVQRGLEASGIAVEGRVLAFSARSVLAGEVARRDGSATWAEVRDLLGSVVVDRADALRDRALRTRAARLARRILPLVLAREAEERSAAIRAEGRLNQVAALRGTIEADRRAWTESAATVLEAAATEVRRELRPLESVNAGESARRFRATRVQAVAGRALTNWVSSREPMVGGDGVVAGHRVRVEALLGYASEDLFSGDPAQIQRVADGAVEALLAALTEAVRASGPAAPARALALRVSSLCEALEHAPGA